MLKKATEVDSHPPILEVLPLALSQQLSPDRCPCRRRDSQLTEAQRKAHERVHWDWHVMRVQWCDAHGYLFADLLRAEQARARAATARAAAEAQPSREPDQSAAAG